MHDLLHCVAVVHIDHTLCLHCAYNVHIENMLQAHPGTICVTRALWHILIKYLKVQFTGIKCFPRQKLSIPESSRH